MNTQHLQKSLGYQFNHPALLQLSLTHRSAKKNDNNERLEFLGDSVLSLIISKELYHRFPKLREGELSRLRAALVKAETIAKLAFELGVGDCLSLGVGELKSGGHLRESILSGAFEAIIGAMVCDSDFETTYTCVVKWYGNLFDTINTQTDVKDAKTVLQEWLQARKMELPFYDCKISGQAHTQQFDVTCRVAGFDFETHGSSTNRKKAEQIAAKEYMNALSDARSPVSGKRKSDNK